MNKILIRHINTPPLVQDFTENFRIRDVEKLTDDQDLVQEIHRHDFFFILALKKGEGEHIIDFATYKINDYSIFFMRPGQVHRINLQQGSTGFLVQFKKDFYYPNDNELRMIFLKASAQKICQLDAGKFEQINYILTYIFHEYKNKKERYKDVIKANLGILFIELVRHRRKNKSTAENKTPFYQDRLDEFLELLETHISSHKQVSQYAEMLNLSQYQLNAILKSNLGITCTDLINEHIILESKRYLLSTSNQVKEIAYHLGYDDPSYFIRFFKKHTGLSPEAFRQNFS
jgi:AraC family transcriptional regulator, transcriptional activator of pobA